MGTEDSKDVKKQDIKSVTIKELSWIGLQVALILLVVYFFRLLDSDFTIVAAIAFAGFLINAVIPANWRLHFFAFISVASVIAVTGLYDSLWIFGLGAILIGLCHLPVPWIVRTILLVVVGVGLGYARLDAVSTPWSSTIWPVIGGMFMFRLMIYAYDIKHDKKPSLSFPWATSYLFMLPNVCFPLFPVVDFKKFQSSYYNQPAPEIYQRGAKWIIRGVIHLILYRLIYQFGILDPKDVQTSWELVGYILSVFGLYLRISGLFHLIVGMLLLFGFNLPPTHNLYYLSSSFNDHWRRINIYWKDFMMKVFFYPAFFKLRKLGEIPALVCSTLLVFFLTWTLHAYQWYWIRGGLLLEWQDAMFWGILALLVVINSVIELKKGRKRSLGNTGQTVFGFLAISCRVMTTFTIIALLWSLWSSQNLQEWLSLWRTTGNTWMLFAIGIPAVYVLARCFEYLDERSSENSPRFVVDHEKFSPTAYPVGIVLICAFLLTTASPVADSILPPNASLVVQQIRTNMLNQRDFERLERGYYEHLVDANRSNPELWDRIVAQPDDWQKLIDTEAIRKLNNYLYVDLNPSTEVELNSKLITINSLGMRDQEYDQVKPENTFRIAVLGASHVLGLGVSQPEVFETIVEERLNALPDTPYERYEVLNFAITGYEHTRQVMLLQDRVLQFDPDLVIFLAHPSDPSRAASQVARCIVRNYEIPYEGLLQIVDEVDVQEDDNFETLRQKFKNEQISNEIRKWAYLKIVESAHSKDVPIVFCLWEELKNPLPDWQYEKLFTFAQDSGFDDVWDLTTVYPRDSKRGELRVAEWDFHPNAKGHAMVADRFFELITNANELVPLSK